MASHPQAPTARSARLALPSVLMRAGTSKGLFLLRDHLPPTRSEWVKILLSALGSRHGCAKQIDGVGGATSVTSKVAVISKSARSGIDIDYTFVQVVVGSEEVDFTGNCGNMSCGVGPFALDQGLVQPEHGQSEIEVRIYNTNTNKIQIANFQVGPDGKFDENGEFQISGVKGTASQIRISFIEPAGSMTNTLLPTGNPQEVLTIPSSSVGPFTVTASLVDAANPFVFVDLATMPRPWYKLPRDGTTSLEIIEAIRREGAVKMGLAQDTISAGLTRGTPKIAILSPPNSHTGGTTSADISVSSYTMGKIHPSFQLTGAVCLGTAVSVPGTIAWEMSARRFLADTPPETASDILEAEEYCKAYGTRRVVTIGHSSGTMTAEVTVVTGFDGSIDIGSVTVSRTARKLFEGNVFVSL